MSYRMSRATALCLGCFAVFWLQQAYAGPLSYPWVPPDAIARRSIEGAFRPPAGFRRVPCPEGSFCAWLRGLPLRPAGSPVRFFDGKEKKSRVVHAAVIELDVGTADLQQCADVILRLRAEYLWAAGRSTEVEFPLTNGTRVPWTRWAAGDRLKIRGRFAEWTPGVAAPDSSHESFRAYLDFVFTYAGTESLAADLPAHPVTSIRPGDVLVQGGSPGHAVLVLDVARDDAGTTLLLLGQGFMPAQDFHVLTNLKHSTLSPWYHADALDDTGLDTPEWRPFRADDLHGWPDPRR